MRQYIDDDQGRLGSLDPKPMGGLGYAKVPIGRTRLEMGPYGSLNPSNIWGYPLQG